MEARYGSEIDWVMPKVPLTGTCYFCANDLGSGIATGLRIRRSDGPTVHLKLCETCIRVFEDLYSTAGEFVRLPRLIERTDGDEIWEPVEPQAQAPQ